MGEVSEESGSVGVWCRQPLILCCRLLSGQGQGHGATECWSAGLTREVVPRPS